MKKQATKRHITAWVFLVILALGLIMGLYPFCYGSYRMLRQVYKGQGVDFSTIEYHFNDLYPAKGALITLNGGLQRLMGTRYLNDRYLMENGHLTYVMDPYDVTDIAANTVNFSQALDERGIPFVYVNAPFKIHSEDKQLPAGVSDYSNENADNYLALLREQDVPVLDLRTCIAEEGLDHYSLFFKTDHHWTAETGFWAFNKIVDYLESVDGSFAVDDTIRRLENYQITVHEDIFLGSAGRRVGALYSGKDDLSVIEPKFDTQLRFYSEPLDLERTGRYQETILFPEKLTEANDFTCSRYDVYCNQDYARLDISNYSVQNELEVQSTPKRLLVFKDSFNSVVIPFLALGYEEVCFIDLRQYRGSVDSLIDEFQPDMVMASYNIGAFSESNSVMFNFQQ